MVLIIIYILLNELVDIPNLNVKFIPYLIRIMIPFFLFAFFPAYILIIMRKDGNIINELRIIIKIKDLFIGFLLGIVMYISTILIVELFPFMAGKSGSVLLHNSPIILILIGIYVPFIEELVFRGFIWKIFKEKKMSGIMILFLTSLLFALYHLDLYRLPILFIGGIILGMPRLRTNRMGASIVAHMTNNTVIYIFTMVIYPWINSL